MGEEGCKVDRRERMIMRMNIARVGRPPHHQWLVIIRELSFFFSLVLIFLHPSEPRALI